MNTKIKIAKRSSGGYALIMVLIIGLVSTLVLAATMRRTRAVAVMNDRNNQYVANVNAAEAAVEKTIARLAYDFQGYGLGAVNANLSLYRTNLPKVSENVYWSKFKFSDGQGNADRVYVGKLSDYSGPMPSQYPGLFAKNAQMFRVLANVSPATGPYQNMKSALQQDVLLAMIPLTQYAIFYNGLLEFSTCQTMTVNGRTHANGAIYVGSSSPLSFSGTVTTTATLSAPANNGGGPWSFPGNVSFNGTPNYKTNVPTVAVSVNMTNTHSLIDYPAAGVTAGSAAGQQLLYNQAHVVLALSNTSVTVKIQASPGLYQVPGEDTPITLQQTWSSTSSWATVQTQIRTNFPFLTVTNTFLDQREDKTILPVDIDVGKYTQWITTNASVLIKFPAASAVYPTILYAANWRTNSSSQLSAVRLTNGVVAPYNGGRGWSLATPNPLYVRGNYNCPNAAHLATTNTSATYPCAIMSDALTLLSSSWVDSTSFTISDTGPNPSSAITVNAAMLTGVKPTTSSSSSGFSGGVHNLPRLLENWTSSRDVWLNTSIISLFNSTRATGQFVTPGTGSYYTAPTRHFSFDNNFLDYNKVPPGIPSVLAVIRVNWAVPPANTVTYNVTP